MSLMRRFRTPICYARSLNKGGYSQHELLATLNRLYITSCSNNQCSKLTSRHNKPSQKNSSAKLNLLTVILINRDRMTIETLLPSDATR